MNGFTTITVRRETYKKISEVAKSKGWSTAEIVEDMLKFYEERERWHSVVESFIKAMSTLPKRALQWQGFPAEQPADPYQAILSEPDVKDYRSTSWMRSEEYVNDNVGSPQFRPIARVFLDDLKIQKIIILSPKVWNNKKVWEWVWKWVNLHKVVGDKLQVFVVREEAIPQKEMDRKFLDMGIYGDLLVGYLSLNEKSEPVAYGWVKTELELETAKRKFEALKRFAVATQDYVDVDHIKALSRNNP